MISNKADGVGGDIPIGYDVTKTHDTFSHQFKNKFHQ
jgi:hypothetical protein